MSQAVPAPRSRALTHRAGAVVALAMILMPALADRSDARALRAGVSSEASATGSGGVTFHKSQRSQGRTVPGRRARLTRTGRAIPPAGAPAKVKAVIRAGNRIAKKPYKYGGGHGILEDSGYDCSGSVSYALRGGRLMRGALASGAFTGWGRGGRGRWITVYANGGHAYMTVAGLRFDTSASNQTGSRWTRQMRSPGGYVATHPPGL